MLWLLLFQCWWLYYSINMWNLVYKNIWTGFCFKIWSLTHVTPMLHYNSCQISVLMVMKRPPYIHCTVTMYLLKRQCHYPLHHMIIEDKLLRQAGHRDMNWMMNWSQLGIKSSNHQWRIINLCCLMKSGILISQNWLLELVLGSVRFQIFPQLLKSYDLWFS